MRARVRKKKQDQTAEVPPTSVGEKPAVSASSAARVALSAPEDLAGAPESVPVCTEKSPQTSSDNESVCPEMLTILRYEERVDSPLSAIRSHCVKCMGGSLKAIAECTSDENAPSPCDLHKLRFGYNWFDKRVQKRLKEEGEI